MNGMPESVEVGASPPEGQRVVLSSRTRKGGSREERTPGPERPRVRAEIVCAPEQAAQRKPRRGRVTCGGGRAAAGGAGLTQGPGGARVAPGRGFRSPRWKPGRRGSGSLGNPELEPRRRARYGGGGVGARALQAPRGAARAGGGRWPGAVGGQRDASGAPS